MGGEANRVSLDRFDRVNRGLKCVICAHDSWCMLSKDRQVAICMRVSDGAIGRSADGWLHRLTADLPPPPRSAPRMRHEKPAAPVDWSALVSMYRKAMTVAHLARLVAALGVSSASLEMLGVGVMPDGTWTFPMFNGERQPVGIRTRQADGSKRAITGSREGVFLPACFNGEPRVLICEGPTDTAAALDLGYAAIGRPSCKGAIEATRALVAGREVVVLADADEPGQDGARDLTRNLRDIVRRAKIVTPTVAKDLREWKRGGLTRAELDFVIANTRPT